MNSRDEIIAAIRAADVQKLSKPDLSGLIEESLKYECPLDKFCTMLGEAGGKAVIMNESEDPDDIIRRLYPDASRIASNIPDIKCATFNPDNVDNPALLDGTEVAVVNGQFGVAENAAVWLEQDVKMRAIYFISEALIILLDRAKIVNNMHEAYAKLANSRFDFGLFISGPSKTADIEQALVFGAHGAHDLIVILK